MLKKMYFRKITVATLALSILCILYLMPDSQDNISIKTSSLEYRDNSAMEVVYLLGENTYLTRTTIKEEATETVDIAKNIVNAREGNMKVESGGGGNYGKVTAS